MNKNVHVVTHPLVEHKLTLLRNVKTGIKEFRELVEEITILMAYEATVNLPLTEVEIETPMEVTKAKMIFGKKLAIVPILRAGLGMMDGILRVIPAAKAGHIGLYRDPESLKPIDYYCKLPPDNEVRDFIVVDPMLATGGSAVAAIDFIKKRGARNIKFMCIIAAPEGVEKLTQAHQEVEIYCACVDRELNDHAYILPGLGDAGDRLFGTK